jgi:hypothetical protein
LYEDETLPLCFYMKRVIPFYEHLPQLVQAWNENPDAIVIRERKEGESAPAGKELRRFVMKKKEVLLLKR